MLPPAASQTLKHPTTLLSRSTPVDDVNRLFTLTRQQSIHGASGSSLVVILWLHNISRSAQTSRGSGQIFTSSSLGWYFCYMPPCTPLLPLTVHVQVEVDLDHNAYANARLHYGKRKQHLIKQQKTLDANEKAFQVGRASVKGKCCCCINWRSSQV